MSAPMTANQKQMIAGLKRERARRLRVAMETVLERDGLPAIVDVLRGILEANVGLADAAHGDDSTEKVHWETALNLAEAFHEDARNLD